MQRFLMTHLLVGLLTVLLMSPGFRPAKDHLVGTQQPAAQQLLEGFGGGVEQEEPQDSRAV